MATVEALGSIGIGIFTVTILIGAFWCIIREQRRNDEAILRDMHERHQLEWFELQREIAEARQRLDAEKPKHAERQHKISQVLSDDGELIDVHLFYSPEDNGWIANIPSLQYCSAFGETPEAAMREIKIAMHAWLASAEQHGILRSNN